MKIILISYLSRSGSTMICDLLIKDSRFCVCPEAEVLTRNLLKEPQKKVSKRTKKIIKRAITYDTKLKHWNLNVPVFKPMMTNLELFQLILSMYSNTKNLESEFTVFKSEGLEKFNVSSHKKFYKIFVFRDPRAIFSSQKLSKSSFANTKMNVNPIRFALKAKRFFNAFKNEKRTTFVKYENFLNDKEEEIKKIQNILEISSLNLKNNKGSILDIIPKSQIHLHNNIKKKSMKNSLEKWKNNLSTYEIYIIQKKFKPNLNIGYKEILIKISKTEKFKSYVLMVLFDALNKLIKYFYKFIR